MGARRNTVFALVTLVAFVASGLLANAQDGGAAQGSAEIDYPGFVSLSENVMALRESRLISLADFKEMATEPDTIILDARSRDAFDRGHVAGAINISFSDFTDETLASLIPSQDTRILIYCNNNFTDDIAPVMLKRAPLALNIPTFINLHGYGYTNVYELGESVSIGHEDLGWVSAQQTP